MAEGSSSRAENPVPDAETLQVLRDMANRLRIRAIRATCAGHPTSSSSAAEITSVLLFHTMRYLQDDPENPDNDRLILSKRLPFMDMVPGWLEQGLSAACGMAYMGKYFDKASYRVYCLMGISEASEGYVWEALAFASHYNLDNLVVIFDVNRLGPSSALPLEQCTAVYKMRCEAFGWNTYMVDGHDVEALCQAFWQATQVKNKPTAVVAKTFKSRGIPNIESLENWHGKPMPKERVEAIIELIESQIETNQDLVPKPPVADSPRFNIEEVIVTIPPAYKVGDKVTTRKAYGLALAKLGHVNNRVVALDGDAKNSTCSVIFQKEHPERFVECFVAEQNMVGVALGCAIRGRAITFASTFAAFWTRAFDQIRMGAISETNVTLVGSHCGVSVGEDVPLKMALEDLAMFRVIPNCTIFYPSDAISTEHAVYLAANIKGMCYIRTSYPETAVIYSSEERFEVGQAKVVRQSADDKVTVIGAGVTLHEALEAADELSKEGIAIRVIDLFTIKPLDVATIISSAHETGGHIITVEDHYKEGGIGEAICAAVSMEPGILVYQLAVSGIPCSGSPSKLLDKFGINARCIVATVHSIIMNQSF
ncbi:transketolase-like protein 1 [Tenrec ecaudatus]|uniref:transketolase-like protein 1 n=1 Tax=Tenrec ecaudatus TaxID=94439 RepID=UPI003F591FA3